MTAAEAIAELSKMRDVLIAKCDREQRKPTPQEQRLFDALGLGAKALAEKEARP